ncbi:MAG: hypothetical protein LC136_01520, partial [Burkholderiales bacterium]|nr:hypothetical protein [Burkholderiales bacterium]
MGRTAEQVMADFPLRIVGENPAAPGEVLRATDDPAAPGKVLSATDGPQFKAWFGDSKVVDGSGAPLVVYHATDSKFNVFDHAKVGSNHPAYAKRGFFFYKAKRSATERALEFGRAGRLKRVYLSLQNPLTVVARSKGSAEEWFDRNSDSLYSRAEAMGADGIVVKVNPESRDHTADDIYVAFHPEQIKSVFNRGTWD